MLQNTSQIKVNYNRPSSNYVKLKDFLDRKIVDRLPFNTLQQATFSSSNNAVLDDAIVAGNLAVGVNSIADTGGIVVAAVAGLFATGSTETITNSQGVILNKVEIRDAVTNDPILDTDGKRLWGLLQAANGTADEAAIGAAGSENLRIVIVKYNTSDVLTLVTYTGTIEFQVNKLYSELTLPALRMNGGLVDADIIQAPSQLIRKLLVTTQFVPNEVIDISNGSGSGTGAATGSGTAVLLPNTGSAFNTEGKLVILRNGVVQDKGSGTDVVWDSTTSLHFTDTLEIGEIVLIYAPSGY